MTESEYFQIIEQLIDGIHVQWVPGSSSTNAPGAVLSRMRRCLGKHGLFGKDEAWLVVDRNGWSESDLSKLHVWSLESDRYGLAVSNPAFEYWVLLHFEAGSGAMSASKCRERLKQYLPDYDKRLPAGKIGLEEVNQAVGRARVRDNPSCIDWPRLAGTTVYRLVARILAG